MEKFAPDNLWEEHPLYPHADWRLEVEAEDTLLGYVAWVNAKIELEESMQDEEEEA